MNEYRRCGMHNGIPLGHKKEWNIAICNNKDGLGSCYAKWNKSKTKTLYRLYAESKKMKQMNECKKTEIDSQI